MRDDRFDGLMFDGEGGFYFGPEGAERENEDAQGHSLECEILYEEVTGRYVLSDPLRRSR